MRRVVLSVVLVLTLLLNQAAVALAQSPSVYLPAIKQVDTTKVKLSQTELPEFPECIILGRWGNTLCKVLYVTILITTTPREEPPPPPTPTPPPNVEVITAIGDGVDLGRCRINPGSQWCSLWIRFSDINTTSCPKPMGVDVDILEGDQEVDAEDLKLEDGVMWAEVFPPNADHGQDAWDYKATAYCVE